MLSRYNWTQFNDQINLNKVERSWGNYELKNDLHSLNEMTVHLENYVKINSLIKPVEI